VSKKHSSQFPKGPKSQPPTPPSSQVGVPAPPKPPAHISSNPPSQSLAVASSGQYRSVQPEQMSLEAYQHVQLCLNNRDGLDKEDVTAILRLAQHLRVFGLLAAVGYLNQAKEGKIQERTKPMWKPLLWKLVHETQPVGSEVELMQAVERMAREQSAVYMATWRRALILSNHWNFWARAYQKGEKTNGQNAVHGSDAD
jgi:hypothetical protein